MFRLRHRVSILLCLLFTLGTTLAFVQESEAKRVYVKGYYRKDGTYVRPHYRTAPDGNPYNNYSFPGNYNPNTGKFTTGNPSTYLENYYKKKSANNRKQMSKTYAQIIAQFDSEGNPIFPKAERLSAGDLYLRDIAIMKQRNRKAMKESTNEAAALMVAGLLFGLVLAAFY